MFRCCQRCLGWPCAPALTGTPVGGEGPCTSCVLSRQYHHSSLPSGPLWHPRPPGVPPRHSSAPGREGGWWLPQVPAASPSGPSPTEGMEEGVLAVSHTDGPTRQELAPEKHLRGLRSLTPRPPPLPTAASPATSTTACPCSTPRTSKTLSRRRAQRTSLSAGLTPPSPRVTSELLTPDPRPSALRYRDYRNALDYNFSEQFWILLAIRLAFLILFEVGWNGGAGLGGAARSNPPPCLHSCRLDTPVSPCPLRQHVALLIKLVAAWFVPDVPQSVKNKVLEEKYRGLQEKLGCRQAGLRPRAPPPTSAPTSSPKSTDV